MNYPFTIDIDETILKEKIVLRKSFWYWVDLILQLIYISFIFFLLLMPYNFIDFNNPNDRVISFFVLPLALIIVMWFFYCKVSELFFLKIATKFSAKENQLLLYEFFKSREEGLVYVKYNFLKSSYGSSINNKITSTFFIVKDEEILFTMLTHGLKANVPIISSHLFLKYDLKKFYARKYAEQN
jgi:hypothetical protein